MKSKSKKIFAIFLVLTLIFSMSSVSFADTADTTTGYNLTGFGSKVGSITVTGATVVGHSLTVEDEVIGSGSNAETFHRYIYNIMLDQSTAANATVTANFTKAADAGADCYISPYGTTIQPPQGPIIVIRAAKLDYPATLSNGTGTTTAYVSYNLTPNNGWAGYGKYDTYVFNYTIVPNSKTVSTNEVTMRFGDPNYPHTAPECYMSFSGTSPNYTAEYNGPVTGFYPNTLALYLYGSETTNTVTATTNDINKISFLTYDANGEATENSSFSGTGTAFGVVSVKEAGSITINGGSGDITLNFEAPRKPAAPGGVTPSRVVSYLPIGQFATGSGWGGATGKFLSGIETTGVSLGALGGYIEFEFEEKGIRNDSNNPYGVDFVVYGNAFNGNPEAGAVQVSEDGKTWYELAGSMYYDGNFNYVGTKVANKFSAAYTGTLNNATVEYKKENNEIKVGLKNASRSYAIPASGTTLPYFGPAAWFPATNKYPQGDAHNNTGSNVTVSHTADNLTFSGITAIPDYNTTASYAFGYADVTPNGSPTTYGNAVNPYTAYTTAKTGGDGFDLEWAVDPETKMPIDVNGKTFHYVRVYSAVLDNGQFGETSTEVCGIFTTANGQKNADGSAVDVGITDLPTVKYGTSETAMTTRLSKNTDSVEETVGTYYINATNSAENIYINGSKVTSGQAYEFKVKAGETTYLRIITQDGIKAPRIRVIRFTAK